MTKTIHNPIIRGFNPDPSIIRVEDDYYIVTSTFEWFPGCQIHHSRDLRHWDLVGRPLSRLSQLDMLGVPDSCGVWAPCINYNPNNQTYYLLYTNVQHFDGAWKDSPNYVVNSKDVMGEWSDPVYLNSSGFDPSFFHDDDGKTWLVNMLLDHRQNKFFGGIVLQQYDCALEKLIGDIHHIFSGTEIGRTEGPHIYKRNGWYYLMVAEGGTGYEHCITMTRSRNITGPYKTHPENPIITARNSPENYLQRAGHGDLVETQNGDWYAVFLSSRPLTQRGRSITGRETSIEKMQWREDDWLYLAADGNVPRAEVEAPDLPDHISTIAPSRLNFDDAHVDINFQALRVPITDDWGNQTERPGYLRLYGRESLSSTFRQSLLARRVQAHHTVTSTCLEFEPVSFQQMAGLVCYYNTSHFHYLHVFGNDDGSKKFLGIISCNKLDVTEPAGEALEVTGADRIYLKADFDGASLQFYYGLNQEPESQQWQKIGPVVDGSILSDEFVGGYPGPFRPCFTGAFVGLACQDVSGRNLHADFDWFEYHEL
jgi:xylan 1,4-beta-xylosidase